MVEVIFGVSRIGCKTWGRGNWRKGNLKVDVWF